MINACATLGGNLGKPDCDVMMGRPKYILPTRGKEFSASDLADSASFKEALLAAMLEQKSSPDRVFTFPLVRQVEDSTADVATEALSDGYEEVLNESLPLYVLQSTVGVCVAQSMVNFNGWNDKVLIVDDKNTLWYVTLENGGGTGFSVGNLYTAPPRFAGSTGVRVVTTRLLFGNNDEFKTSVGALKLDFDPSKLVELVDVQIVQKAAPAANVLTVGGLIKCADTDIYSAYSTALANIARWSVTNLTNMTPVTITSVAAAAGSQGWTVTLDTDEFTALPSGTKLLVNLAAPSVLHTAGVKKLEGIGMVFTKP